MTCSAVAALEVSVHLVPVQSTNAIRRSQDAIGQRMAGEGVPMEKRAGAVGGVPGGGEVRGGERVKTFPLIGQT